MVARMNLTHTVGDIRNFINAYVLLFSKAALTQTHIHQLSTGKSLSSICDHDYLSQSDSR
jgi:hypothetical protein